MDFTTYIVEAKECVDFKSLKDEDLLKELINSVLRLKQEQDSWSDEQRIRIKKNAEKLVCDEMHDRDMEKFRLELANTIWHLLMLSEKYKADVYSVVWRDIEARRAQKMQNCSQNEPV